MVFFRVVPKSADQPAQYGFELFCNAIMTLCFLGTDPFNQCLHSGLISVMTIKWWIVLKGDELPAMPNFLKTSLKMFWVLSQNGFLSPIKHLPMCTYIQIYTYIYIYIHIYIYDNIYIYVILYI